MPDEETNRENFRNWLQGRTGSINQILSAVGNTAKQLTADTVKKINTNLFFYSDYDSFDAVRKLIENDTEFATANHRSKNNFINGLNFYAAFLRGEPIPPKVKSAKKTAEEATTDEECTIQTTKEDLISYMHGFYGFGNAIKSDLYIIGEEEGCSNIPSEIASQIDHRFNVWNKNGRPEVIDIQVMHEKMPGADRYFNNDVSTVEPQSTYAPLINNIVMPFFNYHEQSRNEFQACHFGRENGDYLMFVSDLYPLPCKNLNNRYWEETYERVLGITKAEYRRKYQNERTQHLKKLIAKYTPKVVIMYGGIDESDRYFNPSWNEIAGNPEWDPKYYSYTQQTGNNAGNEINIPFYMYENDKTLFIKMGHPLYKPIGYLTLISETISSYLSHSISK